MDNKLTIESLLQQELKERCSANASYSLRAFARDLEVPPSTLSEIISGKRHASEKVKAKIAKGLNFSKEEIMSFGKVAHGNKKTSSVNSHKKFLQISSDQFSVISDHQHYGLLELMKTEGFNWSHQWIAQRLDVEEEKISEFIERLQRVGLLKKNNNGELVDTTQGFSNDNTQGATSYAQRKFLKKALQNAISKIDELPVEKRDNFTMTFAFNTEDIENIRADIQAFAEKMSVKYEKNKNLNEVYQLNMACLLYTSPSPRDATLSRMPSSA